MQRLVQGDVGSGKTVIAALAAARAIETGWQAALMAPTELLAEQHFGRIAEWLAPLGVRTTWLAGRLGAAAKRAAQQLVSSGTAQLAIGTHALIQDAVNYDRLGLAIVDEQHRFGVAQRLALRGSDRAMLPHMLMLSATPIPRTLAMSFLADLDVSVIDELPPGRRPVVTKLVAVRRRDEVSSADPSRRRGRASGLLGVSAGRGKRCGRGRGSHRDARAHRQRCCRSCASACCTDSCPGPTRPR